MCLADYAIGKGTFVGEREIGVGATGGVLIEANPNRCLIVIGPPKTNNVWLTTSGSPGLGTGIFLGVGQAPLIFDWQRHGNLCSKGWWAVTVAGGDNLSVIEGEFELKRAREFLAQFERGGY